VRAQTLWLKPCLMKRWRAGVLGPPNTSPSVMPPKVHLAPPQDRMVYPRYVRRCRNPVLKRKMMRMQRSIFALKLKDRFHLSRIASLRRQVAQAGKFADSALLKDEDQSHIRAVALRNAENMDDESESSGDSD
ncbi:unnamed protein product, partial [Prorocentrum cordatum]